jgi:uncharacterized membrane protein (UPF0127 family)
MGPRRFQPPQRTTVCGREVAVAGDLRARLLGLALLRRSRVRGGLLIPDCRSVHTFGMLFRIDLVFLDRNGEVIGVRRRVGPYRIAGCRGAAAVLELPAGEGGELSSLVTHIDDAPRDPDAGESGGLR